MSDFDLTRRITAEALGTALLVATVVGSGIMAQTLTSDVALQLLGNTIPTGAMLVVLITLLGPIFGAHFNPAVSLVFTLRGELSKRDLMLYGVAQMIGGIVGVMIAHGMFGLPLLETSEKNANRGRAMVCGRCCDLRPCGYDFRWPAICALFNSGARWPLHHGGLLVYGVDFFC
jgi:glycerol uptake facilitator-like aquaporin